MAKTKKLVEKKVKEPTKGVVILAIGEPRWGKIAENLAMSIKANSDIPIALAHGDAGASQVMDSPFFDKLIPISDKCYTINGRTANVKAKTYLAEISPFDITIALDADIVWLPKRSINLLFDEMTTDFTMGNRSFKELDDPSMTDEFGVWAAPKDVKEAWGFKSGRYYNLSSEFIYFKKTDEVKTLFKEAQKAYNNPKVNLRILFALGVPDELAFTIAMIKTGTYPHRDGYLPFYWESAEHQQLEPAIMHMTYWGYSMGGHMSTPGMKKYYNVLVQHYCSQFGIRFPTTWLDKVQWVRERVNI